MAVTSITGDAPSVPAGNATLREKATGAQDLRLTWRLFPGRLVGFGLNLLFFIVCFQVYKLARKTFITGGDTVGCDPIHPIAACKHAEQIIGWQKNVHLFFEPRLQAWILDRPHFVIQGLNYYYVAFMPLFYSCCGLAMLFGPVQWRFWRRMFLASMVIALPWYAIYPLAPPRFMPQYGFIDTLMKYGPSYFSSNGLVSANQYAAMPSMHIGWSTIAGLMLATCIPRWRGFPIGAVVGVLHICLMTLVVMATANHYFFDELGGWTVDLAALLVAWKLVDRIPFGFPRWMNPV
jgi:hypothetical protein